MDNEITISQKGEILSLHLNTQTVQSSMNLNNINELVLDYNKCMLACFLFNLNIKNITHIGLGAGSLVKWINKFFPRIYQLAIEINPRIVNIAKSMFYLPQENKLFQIIINDALESMPKINKTDILLVDAFDGFNIEENLLTEEFLLISKNKLTKDGIYIVNLWNKHYNYNYFINNFNKIFNQNTIIIPSLNIGNNVLLAFKNNLNSFQKDKIQKIAKDLTYNTDINFIKILEKIIVNNNQLFNN